MKIYLASSWRNTHQPEVLEELRAGGHTVYDFRHPVHPGDDYGFHWSSVESAPKPWTGEMLRAALTHPVAQAGFEADMGALRACDACVLVLPCGRSAHLELGWAAGAGKLTAVLMLGPEEPELMYRMLDNLSTSVTELLAFLAGAGR